MKRWLITVILAFALSFGGIGEAQVKSQFPKLDKQDAVAFEFMNCKDVIMSITTYANDDDIRYFVYEVSDTIFAVVEFESKSDKAIAIYVLWPDKSVYKFIPIEFGKLESPCKTVESLKLQNERNKF